MYPIGTRRQVGHVHESHISDARGGATAMHHCPKIRGPGECYKVLTISIVVEIYSAAEDSSFSLLSTAYSSPSVSHTTVSGYRRAALHSPQPHADVIASVAGYVQYCSVLDCPE